MNPLHWRKMTWLLNVWNLVFVIWIIVAVASRPSKSCPPADSLCVNASDVGTGIGVGLVVMLWLIGFLVLSVVWFMSRPSRTCPACGHGVKRGRTTCKHCGHDFAAAIPGAVA